jgi:hypothetical protein
MTAPALDIFAFQFRDDGVPLNVDDISIPFVDITSVTGLDNAPFRQTTQDREGMDGGYVDAEFETLRTIVLAGNVYGTDNVLETYLNQLKANFAPSRNAYPFYFRTADGGQKVLYCKSGGCKYDWTQTRRTNVVAIQFTLMAEDPTIYDPDLITATKDLAPTVITGRGYDKSFNYGYGGESTSASVIITNTGNKPSPGILSIAGPIHSGFSITNDADLDNDGNARMIIINQIINIGDASIDIDLRKKTILQGTTNRRNAMTPDSRWWMFQPGDNNIRFLGASGGGTGPLLTITTQSAWR